MGKVTKGVKCSVENCNREASRSISRSRIKGLNLHLSLSGKSSKAYLCEGHWKEYKKAVKKEKKLERWRWEK